MSIIDPEWEIEVSEWTEKNFGFVDYDSAIWGVIEEFGEMMRCLTKMRQGIRGTREEWTDELAGEIADVIIQLVEVASHHGLTLNDCLKEKWAVLKDRDFVSNPLGHGLPE